MTRACSQFVDDEWTTARRDPAVRDEPAVSTGSAPNELGGLQQRGRVESSRRCSDNRLGRGGARFFDPPLRYSAAEPCRLLSTTLSHSSHTCNPKTFGRYGCQSCQDPALLRRWEERRARALILSPIQVGDHQPSASTTEGWNAFEAGIKKALKVKREYRSEEASKPPSWVPDDITLDHGGCQKMVSGQDWSMTRPGSDIDLFEDQRDQPDEDSSDCELGKPDLQRSVQALGQQERSMSTVHGTQSGRLRGVAEASRADSRHHEANSMIPRSENARERL
eukprot:4891856-Amphidinium_carterae.1